VDYIKAEKYFLSPVSRKLLEIIENSASELTRAYLLDIKKHPSMPTYQSFPEKEVYDRGYLVFSQLGRWISYELDSEEIKKYWVELGRKRRQEGFALPEIFLSLCLIRKRTLDQDSSRRTSGQCSRPLSGA